MNKPAGVVLGTFGVERHMLRFTGQAAHSGSTPIPMRRDAFLAAAQTALECREIARRHSKPGRRRRLHGRRRERRAEDRDRGARRRARSRSISARSMPTVLAAMLREAREAAERAARENNVSVEWRELWRIEPRPFDPALVRSVRGRRSRGNGRRPAAAVGPASRRRRDGPAHAGRDDVRLFVERSVALQGRRHARAAPREDDPRLSCAWPRRPSRTSRPRPDHRSIATWRCRPWRRHNRTVFILRRSWSLRSNGRCARRSP